MKGTDDLATDGDDDDLLEGWFAQGELTEGPEGVYEEVSDRRSRFGVVIAAVSATALILVMVIASRV
jgi:hypothetical protein